MSALLAHAHAFKTLGDELERQASASTTDPHEVEAGIPHVLWRLRNALRDASNELRKQAKAGATDPDDHGPRPLRRAAR